MILEKGWLEDKQGQHFAERKSLRNGVAEGIKKLFLKDFHMTILCCVQF